MVNKINRQVRWNMTTDPGEQVRLRHKYIFAIVNEPREIDRIIERMIVEFAPSDDFIPICDYAIEKSRGLHCKVLSFSSERGRIEHSERIYDNPGFFRHDRNLANKSETELIPYLNRLLSLG